MNLAEELDLVGGVSGVYGLIRLKGEAPMPLGNDDGSEEIARLPASRLPSPG